MEQGAITVFVALVTGNLAWFGILANPVVGPVFNVYFVFVFSYVCFLTWDTRWNARTTLGLRWQLASLRILSMTVHRGGTALAQALGVPLGFSEPIFTLVLFW